MKHEKNCGDSYEITVKGFFLVPLSYHWMQNIFMEDI